MPVALRYDSVSASTLSADSANTCAAGPASDAKILNESGVDICAAFNFWMTSPSVLVSSETSAMLNPYFFKAASALGVTFDS